MAKKFSELMEESEFSGLVRVRPENKQRRLELTESVTRLINIMTDRNLSTMRFGAALEEAATTSDFPIMLGLIVDQTMIQQYSMIVPDWKDYIKTGLQSDFRPSQLVKLWGLEGALPQVPQHGEYPEVQAAEGKVGIQLYKYGKSFGLTWEDMLNDRLGVFTDMASRLSNAARRTEYVFATNLYSTLTGPSNKLFAPVGGTITHPVTRQQVTNSTNLPLNAGNLATVMGLIRRQVDVEGQPIFFDKIHLVVPASLEIQARRILNPGSLIVSGGDSTAGTKGVAQTSTNILTQYNIVLHVNPYLQITDQSANNAGTWYVFVDEASAAAVQVNYLRNHETPEVWQRKTNAMAAGGGELGSMDGDFEDDTFKWRVRHVLGGTVIDPLGAYVSISNLVPTS